MTNRIVIVGRAALPCGCVDGADTVTIDAKGRVVRGVTSLEIPSGLAHGVEVDVNGAPRFERPFVMTGVRLMCRHNPEFVAFH